MDIVDEGVRIATVFPYEPEASSDFYVVVVEERRTILLVVHWLGDGGRGEFWDSLTGTEIGAVATSPKSNNLAAPIVRVQICLPPRISIDTVNRFPIRDKEHGKKRIREKEDYATEIIPTRKRPDSCSAYGRGYWEYRKRCSNRATDSRGDIGGPERNRTYGGGDSC